MRDAFDGGKARVFGMILQPRDGGLFRLGALREVFLRDARLFAGLSQENTHLEFLVAALKVSGELFVGAFAPADIFVEVVFHRLDFAHCREVNVFVNLLSRLACTEFVGLGHPLHPGNGGWRDGFGLDCFRSRWYGGGMSERLEQLRLAVETMHHCKASHEALTPILETFRGKKVWEGVVESFALTGHPKAKRCYAWSFQDNGETRYVTALEIPPVESPITAVRAAIMAEVKGKK